MTQDAVTTTRVVQVALPVPLRQLFDYRAPVAEPVLPARGSRVRVPFGRRTLVGVVIGHATSLLPPARLRRISAVLDAEPLLAEAQLGLLGWAADYYHHPLGEVLAAALPKALRQGGPAAAESVPRWRVTAAGQAADTHTLRRAPRQSALLRRLLDADDDGLAVHELPGPGDWRRALAALRARGWVEAVPHRRASAEDGLDAGLDAQADIALNPDQSAALEAIASAAGYRTWLLDGVTGSGKTEVYLRAIERVVRAGRQALLLVPEIGLTPQLLERVQSRFGRPPAVLHSGMRDRERLAAWLAARDGSAQVVIGTRSAVFVPLCKPGLIVVDEEHDPSYKQQEGFRYHARDLAAVRASREQVPLLLGSATPSLETLYNVQRHRYRRLLLPSRAGQAELPAVELVDLRSRPLQEGLSQELLSAIERVLECDEQALVYLNRRGYAPTLLCHACGWVAECRRCDARMTLHQARQRLCCHHCGSERRVDTRCPECGGDRLLPLGLGTERIEALLAERFARHGVVRIDRDTTRRRGALDAKLDAVHARRARLLIGTQMITKGHHFTGVTLVGIVNADSGLFGTDFRAAERLAQQLVQVIGRAGRDTRPGRVLIQTYHPEHPLLRALIEHGYPAFAEAALAERVSAGLPPASHLALLRAEATEARDALAFLVAAGEALANRGDTGVVLLGPVQAPMARRGGRHRAQLLLQAATRPPLHRALEAQLATIERLPMTRRVRWSLDVDPIELF